MEKNQSKTLYYVRITGVLLIITMCTAFLLSFVNMVTKDVIAENDAKKTNEAISVIFGGADNVSSKAVSVTEGGADEFYEVFSGDKQIGWYAVVSPVGFKGDVKMIVGLDGNGKVLGVQVLSHSETVGIGDAAFAEGYISGFVGKGGSDALPDAISGATYSSNAVRDGIKIALETYKSEKGGAN